MFTGFPAVVAVSQNITVATPSEAYFSQSSSISISNSSIKNLSSSSLDSSSSTQSVILSSSIVTSSSELALVSSSIIEPKIEAPKVVVVPDPLIVVKPISSAKVVMSDIKKPEPKVELPKPEVKEAPKEVIKQEIKIESAVSSTNQETAETKAEVLESVTVSSSSQSIQSSSETPKPKANLSFAEQITARCEILGCNAAQLIRVMKCESSGNPTVVGSGLYIGLFQFLPSTFNAYKIKAGLPSGDIYNGSDQIHVATYMFASGQARQWGCK